MTRQDMIAALRDLVTGRLREVPTSWRIAERLEDGLAIEVEGERFDIAVRHSAEQATESIDDILDGMGQDERTAFARSLDEAADEAERDGPVPAEELRRSLDEVKARGLKVWNARHRMTG